MHHYTYLIQHRTKNKRYIGVRTSTVEPVQDTDYWGSSKHLPTDVRRNHVKIILKTFKSREEAVSHEILLHDMNNVSLCDTFYNKAKQTSAGFDTTGLKLGPRTDEVKAKIADTLKGRVFSDETRKKMSDSQKRKATREDYVNPRQGVTLTNELKEKISKSIKEKHPRDSTRNSSFKPWFITKDNVTHLFYGITKEEKSLEDGLHNMAYQRIFFRTKGKRPMKQGKHKGIIVGNIPV